MAKNVDLMKQKKREKKGTKKRGQATFYAGNVHAQKMGPSPIFCPFRRGGLLLPKK
jgi:hypothetical protein